jgi:hypothetical protein
MICQVFLDVVHAFTTRGADNFDAALVRPGTEGTRGHAEGFLSRPGGDKSCRVPIAIPLHPRNYNYQKIFVGRFERTCTRIHFAKKGQETLEIHAAAHSPRLAPGGIMIFTNNTHNERHDSSCPRRGIYGFLDAYIAEIKVLRDAFHVFVERRKTPLAMAPCNSEYFYDEKPVDCSSKSAIAAPPTRTRTRTRTKKTR